MTIKKIIYIIPIILLTACTEPSTLSISEIRCNDMESAVGVGNEVRFSWKLHSDERGQYSTAYRIILSATEDDLEKEKNLTWDSGIMEDSAVNKFTASLPQLERGKKYYWKVITWDRNNRASKWSESAHFITALDEKTGWENASWIAYEELAEEDRFAPGLPRYGGKGKKKDMPRATIPMFRKEFESTKKIEAAYLFVSSVGQYQASINGKKVSDNHLAPGWTDYRKTCLYNSYEVTDLLRKGENAIGLLAGTGFGYINRERYAKLMIAYGYPMVIVKLNIRYSDGSVQNIVSNSDWKTSQSALSFSSIYGGESYDARLEQEGWDQAGFDDSQWKNALPADSPGGILKAETGYPVGVREVFEAKEIKALSEHDLLVDFGQNASGIIRITVKGNRGDTIRIYPSELLGEHGGITQKWIGSPHYYEYILKGGESESFQPTFSYYGFRYAEIRNVSQSNQEQRPVLEDIKMLHTANLAPRSGSFSCSNPLFNKIDSLIMWGMISNMQSVMTDCPHREKLGWLEQSYLLGKSLSYTFDMQQLFKKTIAVMIDAQHSNGLVPNIAPEYIYFGGAFTDSPEWGSAMIQLPYLLYKIYDDREGMEKAWNSMQGYLDYLESKKENGLLSYGLGDWYDLGPELPGFPQLSPYEATASGILYLNYKRMAEMAEILDHKELAKSYQTKAELLKGRYNDALFNEEKAIYSQGSQTSMAIPLSMGIVEEAHREQVLQNLVDSIQTNDRRITAGDIGFHFLVDALTEGEQAQMLYDMNNRDDVPGYGYQLKMGATALTESWQALPIKSNNHMMLGHLKEWLYTGLGGIRQSNSSEGFREILIKPAFPNGLDNVKVEYSSPYGPILSSWEKTKDILEMGIQIPVNTSAIIVIPGGKDAVITESGTDIHELEDIEVLSTGESERKVKVGSGSYHFQMKL